MIGMARAKWSRRVWKPMTKEGHSLPFTNELLRGSLVWHCPALELTAAMWCALGGRCTTPSHRLCQLVTPGKTLRVGVSLQLIQLRFHLPYVGENYLASNCDMHSAGERGQNRKVLSYRPVILSMWSKGWVGSSLIAPVVWGFQSTW